MAGFKSIPEEYRVYREDIRRIGRVAASHGCLLDPYGAYDAWQKHSEGMAAGWLHLPEDDDELWDELEPHLEIGSEEAWWN